MADPYLTPERYKTMGLGLDLSAVETVALRAAIQRATAAINSFCAVPTRPRPYSFRGGSITNEEHIFRIDAAERPRPLQIWPWHTPVKSVTSCKLVLGKQLGSETLIDIDPTNLHISDLGYIEVSSLNLAQIAFADAVQAYVGFYNPVFRISYTYGHSFEVEDEFCEPVDARTYQSQNPFWHPTADVEVKVDGVVEDPLNYTINRTEGWIVFTANQAAGAEVTASYTYTMPNDILQACGILVTRDIGESQLREKGFEGLVSIRVKDVELRRAVAAKSTGTAGMAQADIPDDAARYLNGWVMVTAR